MFSGGVSRRKAGKWAQHSLAQQESLFPCLKALRLSLGKLPEYTGKEVGGLGGRLPKPVFPSFAILPLLLFKYIVFQYPDPKSAPKPY